MRVKPTIKSYREKTTCELKPEPSKKIWNSLEVTKIILGMLTPALILWFGNEFKSTQDMVTEARERAAQVAKKRVELWDLIAGDLNDMYCYFLYVGHWKELAASDVLKKKRKVDKIIYSYRPFFSDEFFKRYDLFIRASFETYREWGQDAALRTKPIRPTDLGVNDHYFTGIDNSEEIYRTYFELLRFAATEFNLDIRAAGSGPAPKIPESPTDIVNN